MNRIEELDKITQEFTKHFGSLSTEELNWKPNAKAWSIAQNIDHLMVINRSYFPILEKLRTGTYEPPFMAKFGFLVSFFGKTILKASSPDRRKRMKTFPIWEPDQSTLPGNIPDLFAGHQDELKREMIACSELLIKNTIISTPANKNIVYRLETAFDIIVGHEQRHLAQSLESPELLKKSRVSV
ncbi:MAG: DinB family protein [Cyclobacteriaceae bacterium]